MITIKTTKKDLFYNYLKWLDPVLHLGDNERKILSQLLSAHYTYRHYKPETLNELLFSQETLDDLSRRVGLSKPKFQKAFKQLEDKGIIENNSIHPYLIQHPRDMNFKLFIQFKIEDAQGEDTVRRPDNVDSRPVKS